MNGKALGLAIVAVLWLGALCFGMDAPQGVKSFRVDGHDVTWDGSRSGYYSSDASVWVKYEAATETWWQYSVAGEYVIDAIVNVVESPIYWLRDSEGYAVLNVCGSDGRLWTDPTTGQAWATSSDFSEPQASVGIVDWSAFGSGVASIIAVPGGGAVAVWLSLVVVRRAKQHIGLASRGR